MTDSNHSIAFLFPGQGSQTVGMGKDLFDKFPLARQTFEEADEALGYKLSQLCFEGPEDQLRLTEITQPAILTVSVAALRVLETRVPKPSYVAGHSLGEYSAHVAAGTIGFAAAVRTVRNRGKYMQEAVPVGVGAMAAILGMDYEKVAAVCTDAAQGEVCSPANINSPEQIVISGNTAAVERAAKLADERGAKRAKLLPVSAPFHCSLKKPAQDRLEKDLNELKWQKPTFKLPEGAEEWFDDNPDDYYVLRGFAGVGKTVLVGELIMEASAKDWNIAVTAPTNKAVSILQEKVRAVAKTRVVAATFSSLHSVCGLRMVETDDGELKISSTGYSKFDGVQLLIVDEASMVDTKMLLRSIQNSRGRTLVLFVGDPAQLPPVMEGSLAKVFVLPQGGTMTKIVRQAEGNPLIEASMMIRRKNRIEEIMAAPTLDEQERIMASLGPDDRVQVSDLMDMLPDSMVKRNRLYDLAIGMQRDGRDARIIAYTNRAVLDYNREIHFDLFPESVPLMFATGERVIVQSATKAENIDTGKDVDLVTSEELVIEHVEMGEHHKYPGFTCYVMILRDDLGNFVKVYTPKLTTALNNRLAELFGEVQDMKFAHHRNPRDLALKEKYTQARNAAWLYKNSFADIRHTYSMTTHKSQGSTVDTVLIDLPNLMLMPTTFAFNTALYVAITRPRFEAIIGY